MDACAARAAQLAVHKRHENTSIHSPPQILMSASSQRIASSQSEHESAGSLRNEINMDAPQIWCKAQLRDPLFHVNSLVESHQFANTIARLTLLLIPTIHEMVRHPWWMPHQLTLHQPCFDFCTSKDPISTTAKKWGKTRRRYPLVNWHNYVFFRSGQCTIHNMF